MVNYGIEEGEKRAMAMMMGDDSTVVVEGAAGLRPKLNCVAPTPQVLLLSDLQEISPNPDTLSVTPAYSKPKASWMDRE
jgi:hypothetical protein